MIWAKTKTGWKREWKEKKEKGFYLFEIPSNKRIQMQI
jgi:hypothetical protein